MDAEFNLPVGLYSEGVRREVVGRHPGLVRLRPSIFLADMSGDGLTDLVRVRNGEVCYWPNLG